MEMDKRTTVSWGFSVLAQIGIGEYPGRAQEYHTVSKSGFVVAFKDNKKRKDRKKK